MFAKILIANRGEIALRIIRACRELGIATVAVYSDVDRRALHVLRADEACAIGPAPPRQSYLRIDAILEAARRTGADAIHPGYGFLSENADFAEACERAGITLIGPPSSAMRRMGSKTSARQTAAAAGAPIVPGTTSAVESLEQARHFAAQFGYPVLIKASAGGGGKGMRRVAGEVDLPAAFRDARSEAENAFGDARVYLEKVIERPRHIEVQVFGDRHGNIVHLGERECSIQRRHQKVMEECPSPLVDAEMRARMGEAAVRIARAAGYYNAGTMEFLVDPQRNFYFLEMNTRLQVEHPVTEMVTGIDLVQLQIRAAAGEPLPFTQQDVVLRGHALECRVYAEDPDNSFFPSPGRIDALQTPAGPGVRDDSGVYEGWNVPMHYDPLLSKLVVWAATRPEAIARMRRALSEYYVGGIKTNLALFKAIVDFPDFIAGRLDTGLIERLLSGAPLEARSAGRVAEAETERDALRAAAVAAILFAQRPPVPAAEPGTPPSAWKHSGRYDIVRGLPPTRTWLRTGKP